MSEATLTPQEELDRDFAEMTARPWFFEAGVDIEQHGKVSIGHPYRTIFAPHPELDREPLVDLDDDALDELGQFIALAPEAFLAMQEAWCILDDLAVRQKITPKALYRAQSVLGAVIKKAKALGWVGKPYEEAQVAP